MLFTWFRFRSFVRSFVRSYGRLWMLLLHLVWSVRAHTIVYMGIKCATLAAQRLLDARDMYTFELNAEKPFVNQMAFGYMRRR